jgi:hypothetical protein
VTSATVARGRRIEGTAALQLTAIAVLILLRFVVVGGVLQIPTAFHKGTAFEYDTARYHHIAEDHGRPYRDFEVEFPPVTLAFIEVVNAPTVPDTMHTLGWASLALDLIAALGVAYGWGRRAMLAYLALGFPFLLLPFIYWRIDLLSVALAVWGLALVKRLSDIGGGLALAAAVFAKFWPLGVVPAIVVQRRWRATTTFLVAAGAGGIAWLAWVGTAGLDQVMSFRGATGWNVESVVGGVTRILNGGKVFEQSGAIRTGHMPAWSSPLLGIVLVSLVIGVWCVVARRRQLEDEMIYGVAPIVSTCAFLVCSPVLSPQYLVWLLPFAAICWVGGQRRMTMLVGIAVVLTMLLTRTYHDLNALDDGAYALLTVRNLVLIGIIVEGYRVVAVSPRPPVEPSESVDLARV